MYGQIDSSTETQLPVRRSCTSGSVLARVARVLSRTPGSSSAGMMPGSMAQPWSCTWAVASASTRAWGGSSSSRWKGWPESGWPPPRPVPLA